MPEIRIELAQPGMRLAKPVLNNDGATLLEAGYELTDAAIARLRAMGLGSVHVLEQKTPQQVEQEVMRRFRKVADDPIQRQVCAAVLHYFRLREQRRQTAG